MTGHRPLLSLPRLTRLVHRAIDVLGPASAAWQWLQKKQYAPGGRTPLEIARSEAGIRDVERLRDRVEHGLLV